MPGNISMESSMMSKNQKVNKREIRKELESDLAEKLRMKDKKQQLIKRDQARRKDGRLNGKQTNS